MFCLRLGLSDFQRSRLVCMLSKHCCSLHSCSHGTLCIKNQLMFSENIKEFLSGICPDCFFFSAPSIVGLLFLSLILSFDPSVFRSGLRRPLVFLSVLWGGTRREEERKRRKGNRRAWKKKERGDRKECKKKWRQKRTAARRGSTEKM